MKEFSKAVVDISKGRTVAFYLRNDNYTIKKYKALGYKVFLKIIQKLQSHFPDLDFGGITYRTIINSDFYNRDNAGFCEVDSKNIVIQQAITTIRREWYDINQMARTIMHEMAHRYQENSDQDHGTSFQESCLKLGLDPIKNSYDRDGIFLYHKDFSKWHYSRLLHIFDNGSSFRDLFYATERAEKMAENLEKKYYVVFPMEAVLERFSFGRMYNEPKGFQKFNRGLYRY